jgi:hypothetical protein
MTERSTPYWDKVHGSGMSQRGRLTFFHFRDRHLPAAMEFLRQAFNGIAAELSASNAGKQRIVWTAMRSR